MRRVVAWWLDIALTDLTCLIFGHMLEWGPRCRRCRRKGRRR